jgi:hypothetical protein
MRNRWRARGRENSLRAAADSLAAVRVQAGRMTANAILDSRKFQRSVPRLMRAGHTGLILSGTPLFEYRRIA